MPRPLRIEFAGAFYHIFARGNRRQNIFLEEDDRYYFLKVLYEANNRFGVHIHVYCLMDNHYHLILETPEPNVSQIMHFINASYAIYLNKKREMCGHLFQGRFHAILIQADAYARALTIYIHGNPVRKKITERPEHYPWSSCQDYYALRRPPNWLDTAFILGTFGNSIDLIKSEHERQLLAAGGALLKAELKNASSIGILGDDEFIDRIRRTYLLDAIGKPDVELQELRRLRIRPELADIKRQLEKELGEKNRLTRKCTILLAHKHANYRLKEIGSFFGITPGAASMAYRKAARAALANETLRRILETTWADIQSAEKSKKV